MSEYSGMPRGDDAIRNNHLFACAMSILYSG
jgi:hypothetical protein